MTGKLKQGSRTGHTEQIYRLILEHGKTNYDEIQEAMRISRSTIRGRVSDLKKAGLIMPHADNRFLISHIVEKY